MTVTSTGRLLLLLSSALLIGSCGMQGREAGEGDTASAEASAGNPGMWLAAFRQSSGVSQNRLGYRDDTFAIPADAQVRRLTEAEARERAPKPFYLSSKDSPGRLYLDARSATFLLNNSANQNPSADRRCDSGSLPINEYPLVVYSLAEATIVGSTYAGSVPQESDWDVTYCDSAAVNFKNSPGGVVDGVRIGRGWDGIRIDKGSEGFLIKNSWLSSLRDDAIENDFLHGGRIEDTLIDGAMMALSIRPLSSVEIGPSNHLVEIDGSVIRLQEYPYKRNRRLGTLIKGDERSPRVRMTNSVIAFDASDPMRWVNLWHFTWSKVDGASNNLLLWLSDEDLPADFPLPASGFRLVNGEEARRLWAEAARNWIDCHPKVARLPGDPQSDFARCRPGTWGGFSG